MRYQIYEAKSVKHDAQQRVGMMPERMKNLENVGPLCYGTVLWQQNENILRLSKNKELSDFC